MLAMLANCDTPGCNTSNKESYIMRDMSPRALFLQVHAFLFKCVDAYPNAGDLKVSHLNGWPQCLSRYEIQNNRIMYIS